MKIIIDTNIILSALIKNSKTREIIVKSNLKHLDKAKDIMLNIDPDDVVFIAASLSIKGSIVWSDDSDFKKQDKIITITTKEIISSN